MTDKKLDKAIRILGLKTVLSIKRMSLKGIEDFDIAITKLLEPYKV
jgi:hypothetical protein